MEELKNVLGVKEIEDGKNYIIAVDRSFTAEAAERANEILKDNFPKSRFVILPCIKIIKEDKND